MSYRQGTISVTNGSKAVVGTDTLFKRVGVSAGDQLTLTDANGLPTGGQYEVASVTDDTHLTLLQNYQGTTGSGKAYAIIDMAGDSTVPNFARRLAEFYADISEGASPTIKGLVKLYSALGTNTDGALSQNALNSLINAANGVAGLDASGKVVTQKLYTNTANNVAGLDSNAKVPIANLPVVGAQSSSIIERGSNANGEYVKFADGTMICNIAKTVQLEIQDTWGAIYYGRIFDCLFPASFYSNSYSLSVEAKWASGANWCGFSRHTSSKFDAFVFDQTRRNLDNTQIYVVAIGRWK